MDTNDQITSDEKQKLTQLLCTTIADWCSEKIDLESTVNEEIMVELTTSATEVLAKTFGLFLSKSVALLEPEDEAEGQLMLLDLFPGAFGDVRTAAIETMGQTLDDMQRLYRGEE